VKAQRNASSKPLVELIVDLAAKPAPKPWLDRVLNRLADSASRCD
jgi:hypothetical protein